MPQSRFVSTCSALVGLAIASQVGAGPVCQQFTSGTADEVDSRLLSLVDQFMRNWPQHQTMKQIISRAEQLEHWRDARQKMTVECARGNDFAAGVAFGHDLAMYRMALMQTTEPADKPHSDRR
jgi:hypothetical protein